MVWPLGTISPFSLDPQGRVCVAPYYTTDHARNDIAGAVVTFFACIVFGLVLLFIVLAISSCFCRRRRRRRRRQRPRNEPSTVANLAPVTTFSAVSQDRPLGKISIAVDGDDCAICLEELAAAGQGQVSVLPRCKHAFHRGCIDRWLFARSTSTCPLCRDCVIERRRTSDDVGHYDYYDADDRRRLADLRRLIRSRR
ncbi:RING-H2 finger protein ATL75 [Ananas comosus]|uniref:RING-H2 finger protein ATL75 n=1 Tax=Ananas comosus TaxID=4615 RepID=A0A199UZE3_ANACO|nr:RING-H2 finger protein ATL75 [Ananas comosus]